MIPKIIVLLIIYLVFFSHNDYSIYSFQNQCLFSSSEHDKLLNYNINNINNTTNFSIPLSKCDKSFIGKEIVFEISNIS